MRGKPVSGATVVRCVLLIQGLEWRNWQTHGTQNETAYQSHVLISIRCRFHKAHCDILHHMGLYRRNETGNWWMSYTVAGKQVRESTGTADKGEAKIRLAERIASKRMPVKGNVGHLLDMLIFDYEINGQDVDWCQRYVNKHLRPIFGSMQAEAVTKEVLRNFIAAKSGAGSANASINRMIALLKRSFNIAEIPFPKIEKLKENNVRKGFVENDRFWFFYGHLPEHLKALAIFAYETGCRCSEIISLRWKQLDWQSGFVRLNPGETKNDEGRVIPLSGMTMFMLNRLPKVSDFLFTYKNKPLRNFKTGWAAACKAAGKGYEHFLFHDLRRSAVRNMVRGGTPERVAMAVSGHKTRSVFDRYNIVDEKDLQAAMKDMDALRLRDLIYDPKRSPEIDQFFQRKKELEELKKSAAKGT